MTLAISTQEIIMSGPANPSRIPGDILQTPTDHSAYASSTEDHFSDAPEGPDDDNETTNTSRPTTENTNTYTTEIEAPERPVSDTTPKVLGSSLNAHAIPGSFESDDEKDLNGKTPTEESPLPDKKMIDGEATETLPKESSKLQLESSMNVTQPDAEESVNPQTPPEVFVRWNEDQDKIQPKVKGEKERIERLVEQERSRSKSPSASPVSAKKRVLSGGEKPVRLEGRPDKPVFESTPTITTAEAVSEDTKEFDDPPLISPIVDNAEDNGDDGFGDDDFDDFGEAVDGEDFDGFEGFEEPKATEPVKLVPEPNPQVFVPELPVPILDFSDHEKLREPLADAVEKMFPRDSAEKRKLSSVEPRSFITERSLSLWNQLVAPPPLQPPNWKVSRIRRLFLVSLGVPVDLDEILPSETKQKKLVLPSTGFPRKSTESRPSSNRNSLSGSRSASRRRADDKTESKHEALDIPNARILCSTSDVALSSFTVDELKEHIEKLKMLTTSASEALTHWLAKRDGAVGDKETFETVIESLVGYARKKRQNG